MCRRKGERKLASENYMDKGMCKARLPDHLISKNASQNKQWENVVLHIECT